MRVGVADHFGWAVFVIATPAGEVRDRRRVALVDDGLSPAPVHYEASGLDDAALTSLIGDVRASAARCCAAAFDALPGDVTSVSLRFWPLDFPTALDVVRRAPWEARADAVMYRTILADVAQDRGLEVCCYDAKTVEAQAAALLGHRADDVLRAQGSRLGPPWTKDHRVALAATVVAGG